MIVGWAITFVKENTYKKVKKTIRTCSSGKSHGIFTKATHAFCPTCGSPLEEKTTMANQGPMQPWYLVNARIPHYDWDIGCIDNQQSRYYVFVPGYSITGDDVGDRIIDMSEMLKPPSDGACKDIADDLGIEDYKIVFVAIA